MGLRVVLRAAELGRRVGADFALAAVPEAVGKVLELAGVVSLLTIYGDAGDFEPA